jgi:hypothetical protein
MVCSRYIIVNTLHKCEINNNNNNNNTSTDDNSKLTVVCLEDKGSTATREVFLSSNASHRHNMLLKGSRVETASLR